MFKEIALSSHKPTIATHLKSNNDRLLLSDTLNVQSDRNLPQIKQRSPIFVRYAKCLRRSPS
ncbi:MAG: hypothetical protein M1G31_09640 [Pseudanabaena sp. Salubria-1]|nr:hypothetical protein [Pseudanabaena sp. Salubria-1]